MHCPCSAIMYVWTKINTSRHVKGCSSFLLLLITIYHTNTQTTHTTKRIIKGPVLQTGSSSRSAAGFIIRHHVSVCDNCKCVGTFAHLISRVLHLKRCRFKWACMMVPIVYCTQMKKWQVVGRRWIFWDLSRCSGLRANDRRHTCIHIKVYYSSSPPHLQCNDI